MPCISRFFGIEIRMRFNEHPPPHFHARYAGWTAQVSIVTGEILNGDLPPGAARLVRRWAQCYTQELLENWHLMRDRREPLSIPPLE
jgi:hypothetical protein